MQQSQSSLWQPLIYLILIGFTFIAMPQTGSSYLLARCVQTIEVIICIALLIQRFRQSFEINSFNWRTNLWWLFYTCLAFTTAGMGLTPIFKWLNIILMLLLGACYWQNDPVNNYRYISIVFSLLIYLNAILLIIYPDGLWVDYEWIGTGDSRRFLFGNYNQMGFVCLLGITAQAMYTFATKRGRFNLFLLILVSLGTVMFVGSMTSTVGLTILGTYILLHNLIKRPQIYVTTFVIVYIAFFVTIIWLGNSIEEIGAMTRFVENVLSKDTTFTSRTEIWSNAVYKIQQSPWIGFGIQKVEWNMMHLDGSGPHNLCLMLLLQGGVILCGAFIYNVIFVLKKAFQNPTKSSILGVVSICVFFTMSLFEAYNLVQTFLLLQLVYYSPLLKPTPIETEN